MACRHASTHTYPRWPWLHYRRTTYFKVVSLATTWIQEAFDCVRGFAGTSSSYRQHLSSHTRPRGYGHSRKLHFHRRASSLRLRGVHLAYEVYCVELVYLNSALVLKWKKEEPSTSLFTVNYNSLQIQHLSR